MIRFGPSLSVFGPDDVWSNVLLDRRLVDEIAGAFSDYSAGQACVPPVMQIEIPEQMGQTCIKSAYVRGAPGFAVKISSNFPRHHDESGAASSGIFVLVDARSGTLDTLFIDNGALTQLRTAAAGAVASALLANENATTACIVGTGRQAYLQARSLLTVRNISRFHIWGRDYSRAERVAARLAAELDVSCIASQDLSDAVHASDIVVTTTSSRHPILSAEHIRPGQHITAIGSDSPLKAELGTDILANADLVACDSIAQCAQLGELRRATDSGVALKRPPVEIGHIVRGAELGRTSADHVTIADLTGIGTQDTRIALYARSILAPDKAWQPR